MQARRLVVFVSGHCPTCPDDVNIARKLNERYARLDVALFNVDEAKPRDEVFAVPIYILDEESVFLGNPSDQQIDERFESNWSTVAASEKPLDSAP
jgi:hypothetical protein